MLKNLTSTVLRYEFLEPDLTRKGLDSLMERFVSDAKDGTWKAKGWPVEKTAYRASKVGMTGLSSVLARDNPGLIINACCPGWVKTDMAPEGTKTPEEGARTPIFLAIGNYGNVTGKFWRDEKEVDWAAPQ